MFSNWNGLRAAVGAAALAIALVAGTPVQAKPYLFTVTATNSDSSVHEGSFVIDTAQKQGWNGYAFYSLLNPTGFFSFQTQPPSSIRTDFQIFGGMNYLDIFNDSDYQHSHAYGEIDLSQLITASAYSTGDYNDFNSGTYAFTGIFAAHSFGPSQFLDLSPVSMTLRIGPAAPAPLVGGGVLAALAAAIALLVTRGGSLIRGFGKLGIA